MAHFDDTLTNTRLDELRHAEEEKLILTIAAQSGYGYVDLHNTQINIEALTLITEEESRGAELAIFNKEKEQVYIAVRNPQNPEVPKIFVRLQRMGLSPVLHLASFTSIAYAWQRYHEKIHSVAEVRGVLDVDPELIKKVMQEIHTHDDVAAHIISIQKKNHTTRTSETIALLFGSALTLNASDIHIEPEVETVRVRFRLDGVLWDICTLEKELAKQILSRLKLLSGLKLNIHKEAQDGRFTFDVGTREVEVRSSIINGAYGESIVMRLLDPHASSFDIEHLGLNQKLHDVILAELKRPNGAIITTGPTGSGKTSALYSFLVTIHTPQLKIITLEDPIEYKLSGIVQTQVHHSYSFADGLHAILRQDPDVILVGEIRDPEVARTAIQAALTGHLVFSTLHTNSAAGAFARLNDLGIDSSTIGSACNIILGQRLVRKLCDVCKVERMITTEEQKIINRILEVIPAIHTIFDAKGCAQCGGSGYKGRIGVFEAIKIDNALREIIQRDTREASIREATKQQDIPLMQEDGIYKVLAGITSFDELSRVLDLYNLDK